MSNVIEAAASILDVLSGKILEMIGDDRTFGEVWGWNQPAITRNDLARLPQRLAQRIRALSEKSISDDSRAALSLIPARGQWILDNTIPNTPGGNAYMGIAAIREFCLSIEDVLPALPPPIATVDWRSVENRKQLPPDLLRRLRGVEASLKNIEPRLASANDDIEIILQAKTAAEDLPLTMEDISELRKMLDSAQDNTEEMSRSVIKNRDDSQGALDAMNANKIEAESVLANLGAAYRAATTKGLSAAFGMRSFVLNMTLIFWILALAATLLLGGWIAHVNFAEVQKLVSNEKIATDRIWVQALLAAIGVGGPVWFAWVATKQIGQRFRMAEDYAYKATIAKAYEGYRLEAIRLNPELEARLFANALDRLEEPPLRLVETQSHGSPGHELLELPAFKKAAELVPELQDSVVSLLSKGRGWIAGVSVVPKANLDAGSQD